MSRTVDKMLGNTSRKGSRRTEVQVAALNNEPYFDSDKVKCLGGIEASWCFGFFNKLLKTEIRTDIIKNISSRSSSQMKCIMTYHTGERAR